MSKRNGIINTMNGLKAIEATLTGVQGNVANMQGNITQIQNSISDTNLIVKDLSENIKNLTLMIGDISLANKCLDAKLEDIELNNCKQEQRIILQEIADEKIKKNANLEEIKKMSMEALIQKYLPWLLLIIGTTLINKFGDIEKIMKNIPPQFFVGGSVVIFFLFWGYNKIFKKK